MKEVQRSIPRPISFEADFGPNCGAAQEVPQKAPEIPQVSPEAACNGQGVHIEPQGNFPPRISPSTSLEIDMGSGNKKKSRSKNRRNKRRRRRSTPNSTRSRTAQSSLSDLNRSESVDPVSTASTQVLLEDHHQRSLSGTDTGRMHRERGEVQVAFKSMADWMTDGGSRSKVN